MPAAGHEPPSRTGEALARPGSSPSPTSDRPVPAAEAPAGTARRLAADGAWPLPRAVLVLLGGAGAVVVTAGLRSAAGIVGPAFLALTIAITIHPLLAWLQRRRQRRRPRAGDPGAPPARPPRVLRTTLPADAERRLLAAFTDTAPQAGSASPSPPASD